MARSRSAHDRTPALSDLDLHILGLLSSHRVMTQNQLAEVNPQTAPRTLRYRCKRLAEQGLAGRSRPYRERGSAPHHLWPTRKGEAIVTGGPPPRGGERREPKPALPRPCRRAQPDLRGARDDPAARPRPAALRARGRGAGGVRAQVGEAGDRPGRPRRDHRRRRPASPLLRRARHGDDVPPAVEEKAEGYAAYAEVEAWGARHPYLPALLFVTTTEKRAWAFLAAMHRASKPQAPWLTPASDLGRRLRRIAVEPRWFIDENDTSAMDLTGVLREARRPFDEEQAAWKAQRREEDEQRHRLRADPEALRTHLRRWGHVSWGIERPEGSEAVAIRLTMEADEPLAPVERDALLALGASLEDPLHPGFTESSRTSGNMPTFERLVQHHRGAQLDHIARLEVERGTGPSLRRAREAIQNGTVLDARALGDLTMDASRDENARKLQESLRADYLDWREEEARRLARAQRITGRLRNGPEVFLGQVDERSLRQCPRCEEVVYPDPKGSRHERGAREDVASRCHFCAAIDLVKIDLRVAQDGLAAHTGAPTNAEWDR